MNVNKIRLILKKIHPNKARELKNLLWFEDDIQMWIYEYSFIKKLSDLSICIRLGCYNNRQTIYKKSIKLITLNKDVIEEYLIDKK